MNFLTNKHKGHIVLSRPSQKHLFLLSAILFYCASNTAFANACYASCKTNKQCRHTCGDQWHCDKKEKICLPKA